MHRVIAKTPERMQTDHINGDKLDNRRSNLKICTFSQNAANRPSKKKYKGVYRHSNGVSWVSFATRGVCRVNLGTFDTEEEAARAFDAYSKEKFGEFARLNIPDSTKI